MYQTKTQDGRERVVVTGMGFCLPGPERTLCTDRGRFWDVVSRGQVCIGLDGRYYGRIFLEDADLAGRLTELHPKRIGNYSRVHLLALTALEAACADAHLARGSDALKRAAVLSARVSIESWVNTYLWVLQADLDAVGADEARDLLNRLAISSHPTDVANVLAAALETDGPTFNLSCGCASTNVLLGIARKMIADGERQVAVVTGADWYDLDRSDHFCRLAEIALRDAPPPPPDAPPPPAFTFDRLMRPYDARADCFNMGEGAATLVLESAEHARARGAPILGEIVSQSTWRSALSSATALDPNGSAVVSAARQCVDGRVPLDRVGYVNGGAQGDVLFNLVDGNAVRALFGDRRRDLPVTSQEACFGHMGSPLGNIGVAATLLMLEKQTICPTAGCEQPDPSLPFDPVPGTHGRPGSIDYALSFNYQVGGVAAALLLRRAATA